MQKRIIIRHDEDTKMNMCQLEVPGWAGESVSSGLQLWNWKPFCDFMDQSMQLIFDYDDAEITNNFEKPFFEVSDDLYILKTKSIINTPLGYNLLILPLYHTKDSPEVIPQSFETDWFPLPLNILFRRPKDKHVFLNGKPYAQIIPLPRINVSDASFGEEDKKKIQKAKQFIGNNKDKYITREIKIGNWKQNNLYDVLSNLEKDEKLPRELLYHNLKRVFKNGVVPGKNKQSKT